MLERFKKSSIPDVFVGVSAPIVLLMFSLLTFSSCKKEGYGGRAVIHGKLNELSYTYGYESLEDSGYVSDEYVYIVFGDQNGYGDRVRTSHDGSFEFLNLGKGSYSIYAYGTVLNSDGTKTLEPVLVDVTVKKSKEVLDIGDLTVTDNLASGAGIISGKVYGLNPTSGVLYELVDEKVIIEGINGTNYHESVRTDLLGEYEFSDLNIGEYRVYALSQDINDLFPGDEYPVYLDTTVTTSNQLISVSDIVIYE